MAVGNTHFAFQQSSDCKIENLFLEYFKLYHLPNMSLVVRKPAFCICENKDADLLRSNCAADQRFCFRYIDTTIALLDESGISSF